MTLEEIQRLPDEQLLNELMTLTSKFLDVRDTVESNALFFLMKDLKREALFRMHYGTRGKPHVDSDVQE